MRLVALAAAEQAAHLTHGDAAVLIPVCSTDGAVAYATNLTNDVVRAAWLTKFVAAAQMAYLMENVAGQAAQTSHLADEKAVERLTECVAAVQMAHLRECVAAYVENALHLTCAVVFVVILKVDADEHVGCGVVSLAYLIDDDVCRFVARLMGDDASIERQSTKVSRGPSPMEVDEWSSRTARRHEDVDFAKKTKWHLTKRTMFADGEEFGPAKMVWCRPLPKRARAGVKSSCFENVRVHRVDE